VEGSAGVQIASNFTVDERDIVLQKTRWYAGAGNSLEQILKAQNIDTVIIVCSHHADGQYG
jgi:nicotinamidase-related amidase